MIIDVIYRRLKGGRIYQERVVSFMIKVSDHILSERVLKAEKMAGLHTT
jgi:hypothetical protein